MAASRSGLYVYLNLPNPTFLSVLTINPNMEFIGTRQKSDFRRHHTDILARTSLASGSVAL